MTALSVTRFQSSNAPLPKKDCGNTIVVNDQSLSVPHDRSHFEAVGGAPSSAREDLDDDSSELL